MIFKDYCKNRHDLSKTQKTGSNGKTYCSKCTPARPNRHDKVFQTHTTTAGGRTFIFNHTDKI